MAVVKKTSVISYYLVAVLWLGWALFGTLYRWQDYLVVLVTSVVVWFVGKTIWPDRIWNTPEEKNEPVKDKHEEQTTTSTGNAELDALLRDRDRAVSEMRRLNDAIVDEIISAQIDRMEIATKKIIAQVLEKPEKLPQIRRFMQYYLPTTLKLLNAYDRMDSVGVSGNNIDGTKGKIEGMMENICLAFEKQLDALFGEEALDISTDIAVMEQMLAREGLGNMNMESHS